MKRIAVLLALCLLPLAAAGPGHGTVSTASPLYVHWGDQTVAAALHPSTPTVHTLPAATSVAACGSPQTWYAIFTQDDPSDGIEWTDGLSRLAPYDGRAKLTFLFETVAPGTTTSLALPLREMNLTATMYEGDDPAALGSGNVLASGFINAIPTSIPVPDRTVYSLAALMTWTDPAEVIPAETSFHLEFSLKLGQEACETTPPGIRPYSDDTYVSAMTGFVFNPIRVDSFEVTVDNRTVTAQLFASSPWGVGAIVMPEPPILQGAAGAITGLVANPIEMGNNLSASWTWDGSSAADGTYSLDVTVVDITGATATDKVIFELKPAVVPEDNNTTTDTPKEKESPGLGLFVVGAVLAAFALRRRD